MKQDGYTLWPNQGGVARGSSGTKGDSMLPAISTLSGGPSSTDEFLLASYSVPAGSFRAGTLVRISHGFTISTNGATPSFTIRIRIGGIGGSALFSWGDTASNLGGGSLTLMLRGLAMSVVSDIGAGTMKMMSGEYVNMTTGTVQLVSTIFSVSGNFAAASNWVVTGQFGSSNANNILQTISGALEIIQPTVAPS